MIELNPAEMEQLNAGGDYFFCGAGVAATLLSAWYMPFATEKLAEFTILACISGQ